MNPDSVSDAGPWRVRLVREIRFSIDRDWARAAHGAEGFAQALPVTNSWGGWPSAVGVAPFLVLRVTVGGQPDPVSGYLVNIQELDVLLRTHALPIAASYLLKQGVRLSGERLLRPIFDAVRNQTRQKYSIERLQLQTTPYLSYAIRVEEPKMVELSQCFEFSAAHRLHVARLSDEENRRLFGKCNNPRGHGHNYQIEVTVVGQPSEDEGCVLPLPVFESVVKRCVIDRLDHKHLNEDVDVFRERNPSVENIARTIWDLLVNEVSPATLRRVRVWETAKTCAEYSGD